MITTFQPYSAAIGGALIGLSAVLLMLLNGRIAGISGIMAGCLPTTGGPRGWRIAFLAGLVAAPLIALAAGMPLIEPAMPASWGVVIVARAAGRVRHADGRRLHVGPWRVRHRSAVDAVDRGDADFHGERHRRRLHRASRGGRLTWLR